MMAAPSNMSDSGIASPLEEIAHGGRYLAGMRLKGKVPCIEEAHLCIRQIASEGFSALR
jgi:hypothetical protein